MKKTFGVSSKIQILQRCSQKFIALRLIKIEPNYKGIQALFDGVIKFLVYLRISGLLLLQTFAPKANFG